jgi:hypothetical protein
MPCPLAEVESVRHFDFGGIPPRPALVADNTRPSSGMASDQKSWGDDIGGDDAKTRCAEAVSRAFISTVCKDTRLYPQAIV